MEKVPQTRPLTRHEASCKGVGGDSVLVVAQPATRYCVMKCGRCLPVL